MAVNGHLFMSKIIFEIQRRSADIEPEFANLVKIKCMRHIFHSVLCPDHEFEGKNKILAKTSNTYKISSNPKSLT